MNLQELAITILSEGKFSKSLIKKAIKIVNDPKYKGGDYDHAYDAIEKLKKGLANDPEVAAALKAANEGVSVDARTKGFKAAVKRGVQASLKRKAKLEKADCDDEEDEESIEESITIEKDKKDKIYDNHIITETIGIIGHPSNTSDEYVFISKSKKYNKFDGQEFASIKEAKKWIQKSLTESVTEEVELSFDTLDIASDMNEMFGNSEFSDEFKEKAGVIYESAVKSTIRTHAEKIEESMESKIEESVRDGLDGIVSNLNSYLDYIAEEWMEENKLEVEHGIRTEITEGFIEGLRGLFEDAYVEVPDEKRDLVAEQAAKIEELESNLDEELNRKITMKAELHEANKKAVFDKVCEELTETEKAKMVTLAEDLDYETNEDYKSKLNILKENYFKTDVEDENSEAPVEASVSPDVSDSMNSYINAIAKMTEK